MPEVMALVGGVEHDNTMSPPIGKLPDQKPRVELFGRGAIERQLEIVLHAIVPKPVYHRIDIAGENGFIHRVGLYQHTHIDCSGAKTLELEPQLVRPLLNLHPRFLADLGTIAERTAHRARIQIQIGGKRVDRIAFLVVFLRIDHI